jgi:acetyltransferase-like isoleucine patch superfamily enzyme
MARTKTASIRLLVYVTNHVVAHVPSHNLRRSWYRAMGISIGPNSAIHLGTRILFFGPGQLRRNQVSIGANSIVNRDCVLDCRGPLTIGDNVSISAEVEILTSSHLWQEPGFHDDLQPVVIEDHAWIGTRATILPGTRIGRGAVVSAGAVRGGDVPELAVVTGVPARVIGKRPDTALEYQLGDLTPLFE